MSITTKTGDKMRSRFFSGEEADKDDLRFETYGTLDELVAELGVARSYLGHSKLAHEVRQLQVDLFRVGGELACTKAEKLKWVEPTTEHDVQELESKMQMHEKNINLPHSFLIPGSTRASASLEVARTVARRLERRMVSLAKTGAYTNDWGLIYINRVSDYCFLLARQVEVEEGVSFDAKNS